MTIYRKPIESVLKEEDVARDGKEPEHCEAFFGLPQNVEFCSRCVISNQRPNSTVEFQHTVESEKETISFDVDNICDACRLAEKKRSEINWMEREAQLKDLCDRHRNRLQPRRLKRYFCDGYQFCWSWGRGKPR